MSASSSSTSSADEQTIYDAIGGSKAMELAVDVFYTKVLADQRVHFLTFALGGPYKYNGRAMRLAHRRLVERQGLNDSHFDVILELLSGTLRELAVDERHIEQVVAKCESIRDDVLCREPAKPMEDEPKTMEVEEKEVKWERVAGLVVVAAALLVYLLLASSQ
ncbi:protozoan/cyanobacterial globin family subfamily protein [Acanthamoeba castellanii str. Neff]|uniref:Protozoan/cyanobacterial globin family subfamily protein n=1 Tax=Acanthamoeba castellanii (strain ATCC 30010 / Neff) TaxID=1257118 RepID=L8H593_ACACF|nr:protozoan/cyanobacterial globin family subfamily protein [Acanthamoeba castellanii str. Neff]ELR20669.1 protozoan/cyanobacterial globin family subfamily protein [Acanthamoeba castellanii str. Neff]